MCSIMGYFGEVLSPEKFKEGFDRTLSRGPDMSRVVRPDENAVMGFHRLSIMGPDERGMQPFENENYHLICNGEIYGFRALKIRLEDMGYTFSSGSDCEILIPMFIEYGTDMFRMLDAEFALILYDSEAKKVYAARDPIGIRPLYYGYDSEGGIIFASEPKNIQGLCDGKIMPFPPGHYYEDGKFVCYRDMTEVKEVCHDSVDKISEEIHDRLVKGIEKRLDSDTPVGFLLSGGLDSSLVCAVSAQILDRPIETFAIGMSEDAIDLKYAKEVADFIGSSHHEIIITRDDVIKALPDVVYLLGTYDITTIRASMGMYLLCRAIHETTDIRVLLTGEISDELFGYKYTDFAPSAESFQEESQKRIREIHMYDVLRADRCISVNSLEARVPFGDLDFVEYVMSIDPEKKMNTYGKGKYLLRHAFDRGYLPQSILMREKAAFSDAVGHSMVDYIKEYAEKKYTDEQFEQLKGKYPDPYPFTKESLMYRELFESFYPGQSQMVCGYWMPNSNWKGCDVDDPSARVLSNYGASGL